MNISEAASIFGKKGGAVKSEAKSAAAKKRENKNIVFAQIAHAKLTPARRHEIAVNAAKARWAKEKEE